KDIPERVVPTRGHEVRGHEVGHPEVLDLVPLHEEPAGERAIAAWRIRKVRPLPSEPIAAPDLSEPARERSEPLRRRPRFDQEPTLCEHEAVSSRPPVFQEV